MSASRLDALASANDPPRAGASSRAMARATRAACARDSVSIARRARVPVPRCLASSRTLAIAARARSLAARALSRNHVARGFFPLARVSSSSSTASLARIARRDATLTRARGRVEFAMTSSTFATTTATTNKTTTRASSSLSRASPRVSRVARRRRCVPVSAVVSGNDDVPTSSAAPLGTRRVALALAATIIVPTLDVRAEYGDTVYMEALQGEGKEYGKREVLYPDFERTASGLQYKDMVVGAADAKTFDPTEGKTAVIDWDGYTIGYYGRPFEARNKSKGGAFTGEEKDFFRFKADDERVIGAFREAIAGMKIGSIRRIIVPANNEKLGYPDGRKWRTMKPQPANFSGERALGFVLENQGMIDKTLLFDIELLKIVD